MSEDKLDITSKVLVWTSENIKFIVIGAAIGILIPLSWNFYQYKVEKGNLLASDLYYKLLSIENSSDDLKKFEGKIISEHDGSVYDVLSKFILSKKEFENKNYDLSKKYLNEIIKININETYNSLAYIKISLIHIQNKDYNNALDVLAMIEMQSSFKQIISEIKGDIYKFKGDKEKSLEFYNEAISASAINNENLLMKKNSVEN
jgi:predicted negative regulator of RcsB-dependent stress response